MKSDKDILIESLKYDLMVPLFWVAVAILCGGGLAYLQIANT